MLSNGGEGNTFTTSQQTVLKCLFIGLTRTDFLNKNLLQLVIVANVSTSYGLSLQFNRETIVP